MVSNAFMQLLGKEHADITYLKDEKISLVLSKALAETFRAKPNDPKQYFAKYLLNHSAQQKAAHKVSHEWNGYNLNLIILTEVRKRRWNRECPKIPCREDSWRKQESLGRKSQTSRWS